MRDRSSGNHDNRRAHDLSRMKQHTTQTITPRTNVDSDRKHTHCAHAPPCIHPHGHPQVWDEHKTRLVAYLTSTDAHNPLVGGPVALASLHVQVYDGHSVVVRRLGACPRRRSYPRLLARILVHCHSHAHSRPSRSHAHTYTQTHTQTHTHTHTHSL